MRLSPAAPRIALMPDNVDAGTRLLESLASGATPADLNLVLWRWGSDPPATLSVIDDEGRLA